MTDAEKELITKRVHDHWADYKEVISKKAGPNQLKETKQAFYCGMFVMSKVMQCLAGFNEDDPLDEALIMKMLTDHDNDLTEYVMKILIEATNG